MVFTPCLPRSPTLSNAGECQMLDERMLAKLRRVIDPPVPKARRPKTIGPTCSTCGLTLRDGDDMQERKCFLHRYRPPIRCKFGE